MSPPPDGRDPSDVLRYGDDARDYGVRAVEEGDRVLKRQSGKERLPLLRRPVVVSSTELAEHAQIAINEWHKGVGEGLGDLVAGLEDGFDFGPYAVSVLGNVIWALACFTTGGLAFGISMAGIAVAASAGLVASEAPTDKASFLRIMRNRLDSTKERLESMTRPTAGEVQVRAESEGWNQYSANRYLLEWLFLPQFLKRPGGTSLVDTPAVRKRTLLELRLNFVASVTYDYDFEVLGSDRLVRPVSEWVSRLRGVMAQPRRRVKNFVEALNADLKDLSGGQGADAPSHAIVVNLDATPVVVRLYLKEIVWLEYRFYRFRARVNSSWRSGVDRPKFFEEIGLGGTTLDHELVLKVLETLWGDFAKPPPITRFFKREERVPPWR